jgi:hypothetical protein
MKPGNAGGGKGPQLKANERSDEDGGIDVERVRRKWRKLRVSGSTGSTWAT